MTGTPTILNVVRTGEYTEQVYWSAPASSEPPVAGYEVFYAESGSNATKSGGTTTSPSTTLSVTLPTLEFVYDLFVVAFSDDENTLPSARSNINPAICKCGY